jgi:hypothetical protein
MFVNFETIDLYRSKCTANPLKNVESQVIYLGNMYFPSWLNFLGAFTKISGCLFKSPCPSTHVTTPERQNIFQLNFIFRSFTEIRRHVPILVEIEQKQLPLLTKTKMRFCAWELLGGESLSSNSRAISYRVAMQPRGESSVMTPSPSQTGARYPDNV